MRAVSATSARVPGALAVSRVLVRRSQSRPRTDAPDDGPPVATRVKVYSPESMRAAGAMMSRALTASQENGATVATGSRREGEACGVDQQLARGDDRGDDKDAHGGT